MTTRTTGSAAILLLVTLAAAPSAADRRPMTVDDAMSMVRLGDVAISPDGRRVFYSERRLDWDENGYRKSYFMIPAEGGAPKPFVGPAGGKSFRFSPDGKYLSLLRADSDGAPQVHQLPLHGGEAYPLTRHRGGISDYRWSPDGRRLFFVAEERRGEEEQKEWDKGADAVFVEEGPNGFEAGFWSNLWLFDVEKRTETRLTDEEWIVEDLDVGPGGGRVALIARPDNRQNHPELSELYLVEVADRRTVRLTDNRAPEYDVRWAPDGKKLAYHAPDAEVHELTHGFFWVLDPLTGERHKLVGQNQGEAGPPVWAPDSESFYYSEARRTDTNLYRLDLATGEVTAMTNVVGTLRPRAFSRDRSRMVYSFEDFTTPPDLSVSDLRASEPVRLTRANPWIAEEILLGRGETVRWPSGDAEIEGVLFVPGGYGGERRIPLALNIQGGPGGYWGNKFLFAFHIFAGLGYASLGPNIRGCSGYGDEILRALMGDVGGVEFDDVMTGVDHVIARGVADPERLAVRGWSWGGVLGAWTIAHTDRFRAAALGAMVGDWTSETGPGLMWDLRDHYIGSDHWDDPDEWEKRSPLTYVGRVTTPTILLHGERDRVSTVNQSMAFFTALRERGVPARFVKFPRQGHDVEEPRLLRIRWVEEIRWLQKHVLGEDWEPGPVTRPPSRRPTPAAKAGALSTRSSRTGGEGLGIGNRRRALAERVRPRPDLAALRVLDRQVPAEVGRA